MGARRKSRLARLLPIRFFWRGGFALFGAIRNVVGILLPPSVPGALINLAALLMGKVPVNLNYTASNEVLASCAKQCELKTVITSKAFLERVHLEVPAQAIILEDLAANPGSLERLSAALISWLLPVRLIEKSVGASRKTGLDDIATIIFSSGSTGDPKGVVLSHYNVASNVEQLNQVFMLGRNDKILGILPFFHSFGFTGTLCLPTTIGLGVVYYPSLLESRATGALVSQYSVTFLLATPTFLQAYIRRCEPEDFGSLQYVMAGAEKLPERTSIAFEDRFGLCPLEGYGCTESFSCCDREYAGLSGGAVPPGGSEARQHWASSTGNQREDRQPGDVRVCSPGRDWVAAGARAERDAGIFESSGENGRGLARRMVQHWRHRCAG